MAIEYRQEIEVGEPTGISKTWSVRHPFKQYFYRELWRVDYRTFKVTITADSIEKLKEQMDLVWNQFDDIKEKFKAEADEKNEELQKQYDEEDKIKLELEQKKHDRYVARGNYYNECKKEAEYAWIILPFYANMRVKPTVFNRWIQAHLKSLI